MENKRQVQSLVNKSKNIVRLKSRNPEERSSSPVIVQALCDFKQDQVRYLLPPTHHATHRGPEGAAKLCHSVLCLPERYSQRERGHSEGQLAAQQVACDGTRRSGYADPLCVFAHPPSEPAQHRPRQQVGDGRRQHLCRGSDANLHFFLPFRRNEQYYEAIMSIWNQLYINIKSLISWQYCLKDINYINSLTVSMVSNNQGPLCAV